MDVRLGAWPGSTTKLNITLNVMCSSLLCTIIACGAGVKKHIQFLFPLFNFYSCSRNQVLYRGKLCGKFGG